MVMAATSRGFAVKRSLQRAALVCLLAAAIASAIARNAYADESRTVNLRGGGCPAASAIVVTVDGVRTASGTTDARGGYDLTVDLPSTRPSEIAVTCGTLAYQIAVPGQIDEHQSRLGLAALVVGVGAMLTTMIVIVRRRSVIDLRDPPLVLDRPAPEPANQPERTEASR